LTVSDSNVCKVGLEEWQRLFMPALGYRQCPLLPDIQPEDHKNEKAETAHLLGVHAEVKLKVLVRGVEKLIELSKL
jgi:hypothetical protein